MKNGIDAAGAGGWDFVFGRSAANAAVERLAATTTPASGEFDFMEVAPRSNGTQRKSLNVRVILRVGVARPKVKELSWRLKRRESDRLVIAMRKHFAAVKFHRRMLRSSHSREALQAFQIAPASPARPITLSRGTTCQATPAD
jgi:hypothetical protein